MEQCPVISKEFVVSSGDVRHAIATRSQYVPETYQLSLLTPETVFMYTYEIQTRPRVKTLFRRRQMVGTYCEFQHLIDAKRSQKGSMLIAICIF